MKEQKERQRKSYKHGTITQKMMSFKIDLDIVDRLQMEVNKGRLINNLLRKYFGIAETPAVKADPDASPDENQIEDTMP